MKLECNYREPQPTKVSSALLDPAVFESQCDHPWIASGASCPIRHGTNDVIAQKDKTLTDILARLTAIEEKLTVLPMPGPGRLGYGPSSPPSQHSYGEMPQQSSYPSQLSQQLDQPPMEPSPLLPPIRSLGGNGGNGGNGGSNNLFEFQGDVWAYVQALENQIRELQARLERVEREKDNLVGQLTGQSGKMDMS